MNTQTEQYKAKAFEPRNLVFFLLLVYGLNAIMWVSIGIFGLQLPASFSDPALPLWLLIALPATCGPTIAAFLLTAITEGKSGVKALWGRFWNRNLSIRWLLVTLFGYELIRLGGNLISRMVDGQPYPIVDPSSPFWTIIPLFIQFFVASGMGEEFGWRGYALPRLQAKWNALVSSIVLGLLWATWHIQAFFIPGLPLSQRNFWEWLPGILLETVLFTWVFNNTKGSVLAACLFHAALNVNVIVSTPNSLWYEYGILLLVVILIVLIYGPKNLVRQKPEDAVGQASAQAISDRSLLG